MKILEKRPLAIILCVMLGGFSFFADFTWEVKLIIASVPLALIAINLIFYKISYGRKPIVIVSLVALSISLIFSALWSVIFYPSAYYGETVTVTAKVYDIDRSQPYSTRIVCRTDEIDGKKDKHTFIAYVDNDVATMVSKYDNISFKADVCEFTRQDDGFDGRTYFVSKGYSARLENLTSIDVLENSPDRLDRFFKEMQLKISNKLKLRTDFKTGAFLSALIVGNRNDLSGSVKLDFARLGISHILALSGMHLAILSLALNSLLSRAGINKKFRVTVMILTIAFYMALTGFSASVVRSGLMLMISGALFLLSSKADAITSLSISVFLIVVFNPTAVFDLSLWLSAFATLGVIAFAEISERTDRDTKGLMKIWAVLKNGCLVSVFAFCATFAFTALRFKAFSVVSIFTTLIFSFAIQFFIYGGFLLLFIGGIIPIGKLMIAFSSGILWLAESISSLKFIYVSVDFFVVKLFIVLLSIFFFAFLILEVKNKKYAILTLSVLLCAVFTTAEICTVIKRNHDDVVYTPSVSGDALLLKSDSEVSVIYSGRAVSNGARDILDILIQDDLTYIDTFLFASYSHSTIEFANVIIDGIKVEKIMLPVPTTDEEAGQAEGLSYLLTDYGTYLEFYEPRKYINIGEYRYCLFQKDDYTYGESPENVFEIVLKDKEIAYVSSCEYELLSPSAKALLYHAEHLIIGTATNNNQDKFNMILPQIRYIYHYNDTALTDSATEYYNKKGASTKIVKTPLSFID